MINDKMFRQIYFQLDIKWINNFSFDFLFAIFLRATKKHQFVRNRIRFPFLIITNRVPREGKEKILRNAYFDHASSPSILLDEIRNRPLCPDPEACYKRGVKAYPSKTCGYTFDLRPFTRFIRVHPSLPTPFWTETDKQGWESLEPSLFLKKTLFF